MIPFPLMAAFALAVHDAPFDPTSAPLRLRVSRRNRLTKFPGLCRAADELGVSRVHLWFVLTGQRRSPRIEAWWARHGKEAS